MPPEGYESITVDESTYEKMIDVMVEYECDSMPHAVETAAEIALERESSALASILAQKLGDGDGGLR